MAFNITINYFLGLATESRKDSRLVMCSLAFALASTVRTKKKLKSVEIHASHNWKCDHKAMHSLHTRLQHLRGLLLIKR